MTRRFEPFEDAELDVLWREIVFDDGILYRPEVGSIEFRLLAEIEREWQRRHGPLAVTLTGA